MHVRILLEITTEDGTNGAIEKLATFEKKPERAEDLGLSIAEAKLLLEAVQTRVATAQVADWSQRRRRCDACGQSRRIKARRQKLWVIRVGYIAPHAWWWLRRRGVGW